MKSTPIDKEVVTLIQQMSSHFPKSLNMSYAALAAGRGSVATQIAQDRQNNAAQLGELSTAFTAAPSHLNPDPFAPARTR